MDRLDTAALGQVASVRAAAREVMWVQRAEATGTPFPAARAAGRSLPGLVIDLDASIVICHSDKEPVDTDGGHHDGAALAEITRVLPTRVLADTKTGTR